MRILFLFFASLLQLALLAPQLHAQSDATRDATARAMFEEGVAFAEQSEWEGAEDRFRRAYALRASPIIGYNLASVLSERGRLVEASELLRKLAQEPGLDSELSRSIDKLSTAITPRIGRITVRVEGQRAGDVVTLDQTQLVDAQLGIGVPSDPGAHHVTLARAGTQLDAQDVTLADGAQAEVTLHAIKAPTPEQTAVAAQTAPQAEPVASQPAHADRPITQKWWFWTGVGAVAVVSAVVIVAVASGSSGSQRASVADGFQGNFDPPALGVEVSP